MRPTTLELTGFGTFRDHTTVSFDDSNFFALVGPTGSGKSTVIDAICFALYGSVPRYENENLVAPVISQGGLEARVRLDFTIGKDHFTAVRVVRRSGKGATTKEARLERNGEALAGTADELTDEIRRLIGLSFSQFTRCVVLPQGEFARFLHDKPAHRQDLLVRLLNLDVYERMRHTANQRTADGKSTMTLIQERLDKDLSFATPEALETVRARMARLDQFRARVAEATPTLNELDAQMLQSDRKVAEADGWLTAIAELALPQDVAELDDAMKAASAAAKAAEKDAAAARKDVEAAAKARAALPGRDALVAALGAHTRKAAAETEALQARTALDDATSTREAAAAQLLNAENELAEANNALQAIRTDHAAHLLAANLKPGDPCPVCEQKVVELPKRAAPRAVSAAEKAVTQSDKLVVTARAALDKANVAVARWTSVVELKEKDVVELLALLAEHADQNDLAKQVATIDEADAALEKAREDERAAYDSLDEIRKIADEVTGRERDARSAFSDARDRLVPLGAPSVAGKDLSADWQTLIGWAKKQKPVLQKAKAEAATSRATTAKARAALTEELEASCRECEINLDGRELLDAVSAAHARAAADVERVTNALADAERLRAELVDLGRKTQLANALATHLSARGFEKWLVNEAIRRLVVGASEILAELSGGQYALTIDDAGNFLVTDHHNADEQRSARTLSGGETFLASLSLALALADQLAELAAEGAARLDAIFLDEGFGTLDPETLDTVAATVENLAARGRMVGIVTHVRELAERVPVRFHVKKDPRGSQVEKVSA